jgi:hypothetical protein
MPGNTVGTDDLPVARINKKTTAIQGEKKLKYKELKIKQI